MNFPRPPLVPGRRVGEGVWEFLIPNSEFLIRTESAYAL